MQGRNEMAEKDTPGPSTDVGSDNSAYDHRVPLSWKAKPAFMYVHWLAGNREFPVYLFQLSDPETGITSDDIARAIVAINAGQTPILRGADGFEWRALSYMVFVFPDKADRFIKPGVKFGQDGGKYNYTFLDANIIDVDGYSVFYCTNFRRKPNGERLGRSRDYYKWEAQHDGADMRSHSDSGQNTGP
jgi:hypothetical protein